MKRQLTLFLDKAAKTAIDGVREAIDPVQFSRIPAHITLCYDAEPQDWTQMANQLEALSLEEFDFDVGLPKTFEAESKGIYLPLLDCKGTYSRIRENLLRLSPSRWHNVSPHITLLHPKYARDSSDGWGIVEKVTFPVKLRISRISIIEFHDERWKSIRDFGLQTPETSR